MRSLTSLLAVLALAGCGIVPVTPASKTVKVLPPAELIQDCPAPSGPKPTTNAELVRNRNEAIVLLHWCNRDKAALREWSKENQ